MTYSTNPLPEKEYKGTLEIQFPDNKHFKSKRIAMSDVWPSSDSIIVKSNTSSCSQLKSDFINKLNDAIKKIDTSRISHEFLKGACSSGFCDLPTLRLSSSNDDIIFLRPYDFQSQPTIFIEPKVSTCYSLIEYCKSRDKKTGCMGCNNPYMIMVKKIATEMAANTK